ncbi:rho GTPase-activating protein 44-like isoform X2 [Salminus brasiliensis]|uniref:rho GTPase-activating protein 44-like isoform X2 n=1 Tax=Salminus brasiliensis TaxID=930266 RepID=UPI003B839B2E
MELIKQVSHSTHKKLTACLQGQQGAEVDKRSVRSPLRKLPLAVLAQSLQDGAAVLGDDLLLGKVLRLCGETQDQLAQELQKFELQMEKDIIEPLYTLSEVEIPNIQKQRKHLAKLVLDMDSARTRWQSSKSSTLTNKEQPLGAKADSLREEMDEAANRMEICRDQLSADMYSFMAKETDYANYFQTLIEVQAEYHRKSLELLQNVLPQIKAQQELWVEKPCFGKPLEEHLRLTGRDIAFPIEACVTMLLDCGLQEEGLFRVAPSASKLKKLKASLDCGVLDIQEYSVDPHALAGAMKSYLRELPEPLMTFELYEEWIQASNVQGQEKCLQALLLVCEKLPKANSNNFRYLIKFLAKLSENDAVNKMTAGNIAIVLGPNLLWPQTEGIMTDMMTTVSLQIVRIIEPIIQHADWFFPGEIEFNITGNYGSPLHTNHNSSYSSVWPEMDHSDRRMEHRRPLSVATDNMMLEFYRKDSVLRSKELSPVIGQRGLQISPPGGQTQLSEHILHTFGKAKKLAPIAPKAPYSQSSSWSDHSPGQPSPISLSPTPPTTPSFSYSQVYATISSPGHSSPDTLSIPPPLSATLPKIRPISKPPRHRPSLPPPRPPSPQLLEPADAALLDTLSAGENVPTV